MPTAQDSLKPADFGPTPQDPVSAPRGVLCGSFTRSHEALIEERDTLVQAGCVILSPQDLNFVGEVDGFVLATSEMLSDPATIEAGHLSALQEADFVWLHAPGGYVGQSASFELGFAQALGIPVFTNELPSDVMLRSFVTKVIQPAGIRRVLTDLELTDPGRGIGALQTYYRVQAMRRGYTNETPQDTMLLLTEELGELARAVRKHVGLARGSGYDDVNNVSDEIADVTLYLVHLANVMAVDLAAAVTRKERSNRRREELRVTAAG